MVTVPLRAGFVPSLLSGPIRARDLCLGPRPPLRAFTQNLSLAAVFACVTLLSGCGEEGLFPTTIDPGADYGIAELVFDEEFYYCQIEPRVIFAHGCSNSDAARGDSGCHARVTSFRVLEYAPRVSDSCQGNVTGNVPIPQTARQNYNSSQARMRRDPDTAPFLQKPTGKLSHPRQIFTDDSDAAAAIREWATRVTTQ